MKSFLFQWAIALLLPVCLLAQKQKPTQKQPPPIQKVDPVKAAEDKAAVKKKVAELLESGRSKEEIVKELKGGKLEDNRTIDPQSLAQALRRTSSNPRAIVPNAPQQAGRTMLFDEIEDASEIAFCFSFVLPQRMLTPELLTMMVEEFDIQRLSDLLLVVIQLDTFSSEHGTYFRGYMGVVSNWVVNGQSGGSPAPNWVGQFSEFVHFLHQKETRVENCFNMFMEDNLLNTSFLPALRSERLSPVKNKVCQEYGINFQQLYHAGLTNVIGRGDNQLREYRVRYARNNLGMPLVTANYWAKTFQLDDVPHIKGGFYPSMPSVDATLFLQDMGFSTQEVLDAIRFAYQTDGN